MIKRATVDLYIDINVHIIIVFLYIYYFFLLRIYPQFKYMKSFFFLIECSDYQFMLSVCISLMYTYLTTCINETQMFVVTLATRK